MKNPLFRTEVLDARRQSWLGGISLSQPLQWWVLTSVAGAIAAATVCLLFFGTYVRRSSVAGHLVPDLGLSTVVSPSAGVVARLLVEEGAQVRAGQPLILVDVPRSTADGKDALTAIRDGLDTRRATTRTLGEVQLQQLSAQHAGSTRQLESARQELRQLAAEIATRREQVRIGNETVRRYQRVADEHYVSELQLGQQRQQVLDLVNAQQVLERQATLIRRNIGQLEQSLRDLPMQRHGAQAGTERELAALEQERVQQEANGQLLLKAPVAGLVAHRSIEPGQAVQGGQSLLSLLPKGSRLQAQLMVPSRAIGFIEPGDRVQLRYQAFPYQKFGHHVGRVLRISRSTSASSDAESGSEAAYRVLVELERQSILAYGRPEALRPGMRVDADILGERRRLYEWVLEPLYSVLGKRKGV